MRHQQRVPPERQRDVILPEELQCQDINSRNSSQIINLSNVVLDAARPLQTLLHLAAEQGDEELVQMLVHRGIDVNTTNNNGDSPLLTASKSGEEAMVKRLLAYRGVVVDHRNAIRATPLIEASIEGHTKIVKLLLDAGADVNAQNSHGNSPLSIAAEYGRDDTVTEILKRKNINVSPIQQDGRTPLHWAALKGYSKITGMLLDHGANVNVKDNHGDTALSLARNRAIAKILQSYGAI